MGAAKVDAVSDRDDDARWRLISVLFSTHSLTPAVARALFDAACGLYQADTSSAPIRAGYTQGRVDNLRQEMCLGTVGGPAFEATLDTERGAGTVRYFITRAGLEFMASQMPAGALN